MAFGSIAAGGRGGGFGSSFPTRGSMPNSQTVDYLKPKAEWESDFNSRIAAEQGRVNANNSMVGNAIPATPTAGFDASVGFDPNMRLPMPTGDYGPFGPGIWEAPQPYSGGPRMVSESGPTVVDGGMPPAPTAPSFNFNPTTTSMMSMDMTPFNQEREKMMGEYDAQSRNQQAYDSMLGGGQINGVLGPNYTDPNFGQVNGQNADGIPENTDMSWADGLYSAGGTYKAPMRPGKGGAW